MPRIHLLGRVDGLMAIELDKRIAIPALDGSSIYPSLLPHSCYTSPSLEYGRIPLAQPRVKRTRTSGVPSLTSSSCSLVGRSKLSLREEMLDCRTR